jgi:PAS domain S-box-containing protein
MKITGNSLSPLIQNVILGSVTGIVVGFVIRVYYQYVRGTDIVWMLFFLVGPLIGYLSGRERERVEKLQKEKQSLQDNLDKIQIAFKRSTNTYKALIESASDAIFLTTKDGRFVLFNEATCLLSGYKREELKKMNLSQLQMESDDSVKHRKAWLDNGICRYEDKWATKDGGEIFLEINVKWMQISGYELILHIGRDILRRKETDEAGKSDEIKGFQTDKIIELARVNKMNQENVYKPAQKIMDTVQTILNDFKVPEQKERFAEVLNKWEETRTFVKEFLQKARGI